MNTSEQECILVVDDHLDFRQRLAQCLRAAGHEVVEADTGLGAFLVLRDRRRPIGWLCTRAALPSLIDGWILADEYHDGHRARAAVIAAQEERCSPQGHIVLAGPTPEAVCETIVRLIEAHRSGCDRQLAA